VEYPAGFGTCLFNDFDSIPKWILSGYDKIVVGVIVCQAMTGLVVALVMKYGDTILKGFATSVAVVLPPSCQSLSGTRTMVGLS
jgi:hypothetical protein